MDQFKEISLLERLLNFQKDVYFINWLFYEVNCSVHVLMNDFTVR